MKPKPLIDYFGGCPYCGLNDGCLNLGRDHWYVCHTHRTKWWVGSNLFSSWRHEDEEDWALHALRIRDYEEVESVNDSVWAYHPNYGLIKDLSEVLRGTGSSSEAVSTPREMISRAPVRTSVDEPSAHAPPGERLPGVLRACVALTWCAHPCAPRRQTVGAHSQVGCSCLDYT